MSAIIASGQRSLTRIIQIGLVVCALLTAMATGFLITEQPLIVILGVAGLGVALASLIWPDTTTLSFFLILLTNSATIAVKFHNLPTIVGVSFPLLLLVPVANYIIFRRQKVVLTPAFFLLMCLLLVECLGTFFAQRLSDAFLELQTFTIEAVLIYFLILNAIRSPQTLRRVVLVFMLSGIILGIVPIYQQLTRDFRNNFWGYGQITTDITISGDSLSGEVADPRLAGAIGEKNRFAQFMLMFGMVAVSQISSARTRAERAIALAATGISFTAAALPYSRGAAVGLALTIVIAVPLSIITLRQFLVILLAASLALLAFPHYLERLLSLGSIWDYSTGNTTSQVDGATLGRSTEMQAAFLVYIDHPFIGVGPGQYRYYAQDVGNSLGIRHLEGERQAHDLFLDIAANTGTFGLLFTLGILFVTLRDLRRVQKRWRREHPELASIATGFTLAIVTYLTTGIFLHHAYVRYFWSFMAVAGATILVARQLEQQRIITAEHKPS